MDKGCLEEERERGASISGEVITGLHTKESEYKVVFDDSMGRHAKWLELSSGGIWSIHCSIKNPPEHPLPLSQTPS